MENVLAEAPARCSLEGELTAEAMRAGAIKDGETRYLRRRERSEHP